VFMKKRNIFLIFSLTLMFSSACNAVAPTATPQPTRQSAPPELTVIVEPTALPTRSDLPRDEAAVPRISVEQARAALESGAAVIVDVRSAEAYEQEHIAGAISVPLAEIESSPTELKLEQDQWIITYCT
jgi:hypothetical protein